MKIKLFFLIIFCISISGYANDTIPLINVNGAAEKYVDPNMVIISIETFGRSELAKVAQEKQAIEFQRIKKITEKFKIKKDDFITDNISVSPEYKYDEKYQINRTIGFRVSHQLKIILRNKEDAGVLLDALASNAKAEQSGVSIQSIAWDNDRRKIISEDLIQEAVKDAKQKADRLANASGVKLKGVQSINYYESSPSVVRSSENFMRKSSMMAESVSTELGSGSVKIRTEVTLQYRIE